MDFTQLSQRAIQIRAKYALLEQRRYGKEWTREQIAEGLVGDVGDLLKLVQAKSGIRTIDSVDEKMAHELSDCLWSVLVLADKYGVDLEKSFTDSMNELDNKIDSEM